MEFRLVNVERELWSGEALFVSAPGVEGELGIAPGHTPLLTSLLPGPVEVRTKDDTEVFHVSGGILEVEPQLVILLADGGSLASELNEQEVEAQLREARLQAQDESYDAALVRAHLIEATARLHALRRLRRK